MDKWEIEKKIAIHCMKNPQFKQKLISNPKEAIREFLGKEKGFHNSMLEKVNIVVHQEKKNEFHISVPYVDGSESLSEESLRKVSGGIDCWGTVRG